MNFTQEEKESLSLKLLQQAAGGLKEGTISQAEMMFISSQIEKKLLNLQTHEDLVLFLAELSESFPMFSSFLTIEQGKEKEMKTGDQINEIRQQILNNKQQQNQ